MIGSVRASGLLQDLRECFVAAGNSLEQPVDDPVTAVAGVLLAQKGQIEYLCEAALPESVTLDGLLRGLRRVRDGWLDQGKKLALARAAVEVCFEHEDVGGLVVPFMNRLGIQGEEECKRAWQDRIGPAVRAGILDWAGAVPEFHWKYVGPVRLHTGVPRLLIPRFARLLFDIACDYGLEALPSLPRKCLGAATEQAFAGTTFASEFLRSQTGEDFTRAAGAVIARAGWPARRDITARVVAEPGFHRGFLQQVAAELNMLLDGEQKRPRRGVPSDLWPQLVVLEQAGRLALRFPGLVGTRRCRYSWDQGGSSFVKPVMQLGRSVQYRDVFSGDIELGDLSGEWSLVAWPRRSSRWAAFDLQGGMVASHGEKDAIESGEYLLALPDARVSQVVSTPGVHLRADLGPLDFDGANVGDFTLVHVTLSDGTRALEELSVVASSSVPRLSCTRAHPLSGLVPAFDAVLGPRDAFVFVNGWGADRAAQFRITLEAGSAVHDVTTQLHPFADGHRLALPNHPHAGIVRVEGRGRRSGSQKSESALSYVVWPMVSVEKSVPVLGMEETGTLTVLSAEPVETASLDGALFTGPCEVPPPVEDARFVLKQLGLRVELCVRIPRARVTSPAWVGTPVFIDRSDVERGAQATSVGRLGDFVVHVAPGRGWVLRIRSNDAECTLFEVSSFEAEKKNSGRYPLRWSQVVDAMRAFKAAVGSFELVQCGRTLPLNAYLVDSAGLHTPGRHSETIPDAPKELREPLLELEELQSGNAPSSVTAMVPCDAFQQVIDAWRSCARVVFGESTRLDGQALQLSQIMQRSHSRLRPVEAAQLLDQFTKLEPDVVLAECGVARHLWPREWKCRFDEAKRLLTAAADLTGMMGGLRRAILGNAQLPDAEVPDGLFNGLREYRAAFSTRSREEQAARAASVLKQLRGAELAAEPWGEVARTFFLLALLRRGYVSEFLKECNQTAPHFALPPCLTQIADDLRGVSASVRTPECPWCLSDVSPLEDDVVLDRGEEPGSNGTWLSAWVCWRRCVRDGGAKANELHRRASCRAGEVPGTLQDRDRILSELELGRLAEWQ